MFSLLTHHSVCSRFYFSELLTELSKNKNLRPKFARKCDTPCPCVFVKSFFLLRILMFFVERILLLVDIINKRFDRLKRRRSICAKTFFCSVSSEQKRFFQAYTQPTLLTYIPKIIIISLLSCFVWIYLF